MKQPSKNVIDRKKIIALREATGMGQADVASVIDSSQRFMCDIEGNSGYNPGLTYTVRLAAFYGVPVEDIIDKEKAEIPEMIERKKNQEVVVKNRELMKKVKAPMSRLQDRIQTMIREFEETNKVSLSLSYNKRKKKVNTTVNILGAYPLRTRNGGQSMG